MESKNIVAIEIASSKIKGAAGSVTPDGKLTVIALEEIPATNNVRYGRIQNIREVSGAVNEIIRRLEAAVAPGRVTALAISIGGRSLAAAPTKAALQFPHECEITESHVQRLVYEATRDFMGDRNIEAMVPRMFYVNNAAVRKAVGTFGETLRGEFMMLTCGKETRQNLDRLKFDYIDNDDVEYILRPLAVADLVLTSGDRELGCALVDIGAETTTVSVYKDGTLAFLATIPMGSRLITLDLMAGLGATEEAAEGYKVSLSRPDGNVQNHPGDPDPEEISAYVRARVGEIAANIINQIERSGFNAESLSKIVLVGGGAKLPEFTTQLSALCKTAVEVAQMPQQIVFRIAGGNRPDNIDIVALLSAARHSGKSFITIPAKPDEEPEPDDEPVADTKASTATATAAAIAAAEAAARTAAARQVPAEDDDSLLDDDDDEEDEEYYGDEEEQETAAADDRKGGGKRFGFFNFGKKQPKEEPAPVDDDSYNVFEGDDAEEDPDPDHYKQTSKIISGFRNRLIDMLRGNEFEDDNE